MHFTLLNHWPARRVNMWYKSKRHTVLWQKNIILDHEQRYEGNDSSGGDFYLIVKSLFENGQRAAILYEDSGVTRANGTITSLFERDGIRWFQLDGKTDIRIDRLYAVNGTFSSDYSEC